MIVDKEAMITANAAGFDLGTVRPGPGQALHCAIVNDSVVDGTYTGTIGAQNVAITHGANEAAAEAGADALMNVDVEAGKDAYFTLPSTTKRWIAVTTLPANAALVFIFPTAAQTNL